MTPTNCTVCGWPQIRRAGGHASWCAHVAARMRDGTLGNGRPTETIDYNDVLARRQRGESFATIAAEYGVAESTLYGKWNRWVGSVA